MRLYIHTLFIVFFLFNLIVAMPMHAQLGFDLDIKKPAPYENRELKAEKSGEKKIQSPPACHAEHDHSVQLFF